MVWGSAPVFGERVEYQAQDWVVRTRFGWTITCMALAPNSADTIATPYALTHPIIQTQECKDMHVSHVVRQICWHSTPECETYPTGLDKDRVHPRCGMPAVGGLESRNLVCRAGSIGVRSYQSTKPSPWRLLLQQLCNVTRPCKVA